MKFPLSASVLPSILVGLAACTPTDEQTNGNRAGETVALSVDHRTEWRALWIEGSTDLPDGALVAYRVTHELAATAPADEWPARNLIDAGKAAVQDGQYWTRLNTSNWPPGAVRILIQFPVPPQPDFVVERYGELGETLSGSRRGASTPAASSRAAPRSRQFRIVAAALIADRRGAPPDPRRSGRR